LPTAATAIIRDTIQFAIDARELSPALIQFSQQSGLSIAFSDRLTRDLPAPTVIGTMSSAEALDRLLEESPLDWQLVSDKVVAVYEADCRQQITPERDCATAEETLSRYPLYVPGIEETYIYGTRLTGSRIRRIGFSGAAPVDILSAPDIELSGAQTIGELLKFVPAVAGNSLSTAISNGGDGTATVTLRGLPASNTLVLINGRRVANDGLAGESVDLNSIPPAAVERIEILKDGASAIYGSDAIAGVVNVIMKKDFYGVLAEAYYGEAERGDLETMTQTLQYGTGLPDGSLFLSLTSYRQDPIFSRDRAVSADADTSLVGGTDQRSSATPDARITLPGGDTLIATRGGYRPAREDDLFNYQQFTSAVASLERNSIYGNLSYDFSERVTSQIEFSYLETDSTATLAPTPVFTAFEQTPLVVAASNAYNPFGLDLEDTRRRLVEFPQRRQHNESQVGRFSALVEGIYADWNWELAYSYSRSDATERTENLVNAENLRRALGPADQCLGLAVDGCLPVNLVGPAGSIDPAQVSFLRVDGEVEGFSKLASVQASISNALLNLPFGRGDVAFGFEHRQESTRKRPDRLLASIGTIGATNFQATAGKRHISELYAETVFPAWKNRSGLYSLDVEAAVRYSTYSDFGTRTTPKFGLRLQLGPAVLLRSTYAESFRAPSLNELYEGATEEQAFISDPCQQPQNIGVLPGCQQLADPSRNQFLVVKGGNPLLQSETANTYGAGIVWTPQSLPGLALSADYFRIDQEGVVDASAQFIVNQNAERGQFAEQVTRDEQGNLALVTASNINVGERRVSGMDLALNYHHPQRAWGQLSLLGSATWIEEYQARLDSSEPALKLAGTFRDEASEGLGGIPQWKARLGLRWNHKRWRGNYQIHYVGQMREELPGTESTRSIESWTVHDLQISYKFDVLKGLRWTVGLDNALDTIAPLAASAFNDNIDGRTHELKGRFWYTKLSQRF
jgi:iron complex outermembrane receptor protein